MIAIDCSLLCGNEETGQDAKAEEGGNDRDDLN